MEYLYGVLSSISRDLVCGAVDQLRYPCCFNNFVEELEKEGGDLIVTRNSVKDRIAHAKKQTRRTAEVVDKWLENAKIDVDNVNNLLTEARTKNSCCFGHCPNWIFRYRLGKKLANKKEELEKFIKEGGQYVQLERVATLPPGILDFSSEKYLSFGSRQKAYEELMEAVKDDEVGMIGLYGMGGCGKTTMAEKIKKIAEAEHLFDKVIFVTVSNTVQVRRIQDKIASSLGYTFPENEERERAIRLCTRLTQEKKILVILDDAWQKLNFDSIGIPSTEHHKGCKVLITTRSKDVCYSMNCKTIHLPILEDEEAWTLFQKEANINEGTSDTIKHLARQISNKCKGLLVAIAAVASSLKGKDEVIWKVALNRLKSSKLVNIEKGLLDPYKCLELSYHYLDHEEAKSLFLLCSVFPEDYEISIELLTRCAIGLGVVGEVCSYEEARNEVIAAKIKLVTSCLLMLVADDYGGECVKMHDLVRDVAHLIAKNENKLIKCEVENDMTLQQNAVRYLWCKKFPNDLDCSNLEFLCITTEVEVLDEIFTRMRQLRVLFLDNKGRNWMLPLSTISFKTLTNLRCLSLSRWKLSDISFVRDMKKLESLSLNECSLPSFLDLQKDDVVTQLTKLKLLVLRFCKMERNIFEVIGRIPQLEELCIIDTSQEWDDYSENTIEFFKSFSVPQTLQRYTIMLGSQYDDVVVKLFAPPERILLLSYFHIPNEAVMCLAKKAKILGIRNIKGGTKNIIPDIFQWEEGGMPELNELDICDSKEIECLVDTSNHTSEVVGTLFSNLLELSIDEMDDLRVLWHGCLPPRKLERLNLYNCRQLTSLFTQAITPNPVRYTIFQNLQQVTVTQCGELKYVFSANTVGGLPQLKKLEIYECRQLDQIIEDTTPSVLVMKYSLAQHDQRQELGEIIEDELHQPFCNSDLEANQLEIIPKNTSTPSTPLVNHSSGSFTMSKLTSINLGGCPKLGSLFPASTAKTLISLEYLMIRDCHGLKHLLTCERAYNSKKQNSVEDDHDLQSVISLFLSLKSVRITKCDLLQHIFCVFFVGGQNDFEDNSCHLQHKNIQIGRQASLMLEELNLCALPQMTCIWVASKNSFTLQYLKTLQITRCAKLEVIFPLSVVRCLPELEHLEIIECKELKQIMEEENENDTIQRELKPCFPKLTVVIVNQCHKLKHLFSMSASSGLPNLEALMINGADELEELIECEQRKGEEIGKSKVELPKLKLLIFMHLSNLCQGNELLYVKHCIINNCPKLSLTSTTTLQELRQNFSKSDFENLGVSWRMVYYWILEINESNEVSKRGDTNDFPSSQINEKLEKEFIGEVHGSEVHNTTTSTDSELDERSSPSPLDIHQRETNIELEWDPMPENISPLQMNHEDPTTSKSEQASTQINDNKQSILRNITETVHKHKQIESGGLDFESNKFLALEKEGKRIKTSSTGVEVISLGGNVEQDDKLNEGKTDSVVTRTRLEAYKQFVDLDDAQIALLEEAITSYHHLWNACEKFSERFQAWMLKTLADMLLFLQNESGHTVTPERETEFHKLCDEAVELGFDKTWVDEMRQYVVARDPKLEENRAQGRINDLFRRSTGANMVPNSQVVEQGDGSNEHCIGTSQCQKMIQNVGNSIQEGSNLLDYKEGEIGVVSNDCIVAQINEESEKFGSVDRQSNSEPYLMNHQKSLGEIVSTLEIPQCLEETKDLSIQVGAKLEKTVTTTFFSDSEMRNSSPQSLLEEEPLQKNIKSVAEEGTISNNNNVTVSSVHSKSATSQSGQIVTSQSKSYPHNEARRSETKTHNTSRKL